MSGEDEARVTRPFRWRGWGLADAVYGALVVVTFARFVPWRTPACNVVALAYGVAHLLPLPWLWQGRRGAWRVAVGVSVAGVALGFFALAGLFLSWLFLRSSFGTFGAGASLVCVLLGVVLMNVTGLFPALRLAALVRRRPAAEEPARPRSWRTAVGVFVALPVLGVAAAALAVTSRFSPRASPESDPRAVAALARAVRDGLPHPEGVRADATPGAGWTVSLYRDGERMARVSWESGEGPPLAARAGLPAAGAAPFVLLERTLDRRPLPGHARWGLALGVVPGDDGVEGQVSHRGFGAVDAVAAARFGVAPLLPALAEVRLGLDADWATAQLPPDEPWVRVRLETWLVGARDGELWRVRGGRAVRSFSLTTAEVAEAARRAAAFLVRAQGPDGRFRYRLDARLATAELPFEDGGYDLARHAGTTAVLARYAALRAGEPDGPALREAAVRAAAWLLGQRSARGVVSSRPEESRLGENALTLLAFLAAAQLPGDAQVALRGAAETLVGVLESLVSSDGRTVFRFDPQTGRPTSASAARGHAPTKRPMFEAEEAAYALVLAHRQLGRAPAGTAARAVLDELLHRRDSYFLGWFVYGADAWTCLAAEAGDPAMVPPDADAHCRGYASFLRRMQDDANEPFPDRDGQYGFSDILVPQTPAVAGFSEAVVATWSLAHRRGEDVPALTAQARAGLRALVREQLRRETAFLARDPDFVDGAFQRSSVEPEVRVDFVQHALSALMGALRAEPGLLEQAD